MMDDYCGAGMQLDCAAAVDDLAEVQRLHANGFELTEWACSQAATSMCYNGHARTAVRGTRPRAWGLLMSTLT